MVLLHRQYSSEQSVEKFYPHSNLKYLHCMTGAISEKSALWSVYIANWVVSRLLSIFTRRHLHYVPNGTLSQKSALWSVSISNSVVSSLRRIFTRRYLHHVPNGTISQKSSLWSVYLVNSVVSRLPPSRHTQIPQYLAVQIYFEILIQFECLPRNLSFRIRWISGV